MVRLLVRGEDPERDIVDQAAMDAPRRTLADAVRIEQHAQHQRRLMEQRRRGRQPDATLMLLILAFGLAAAAGAFGAFITKVAPVS